MAYLVAPQRCGAVAGGSQLLNVLVFRNLHAVTSTALAGLAEGPAELDMTAV
jgi:hypothetical protein